MKNTIVEAFERTSWLVGLIVIVTISIHIAGIVYYSLSLSTQEFARKKSVQTYENNVEKVMKKDKFERTLHYWKNNLTVGAKSLIPVVGATYTFKGSQYTSLADAYRYHAGGWDEMMNFMGGRFLHSIPESLGFFLLASLSLYVVVGVLSRRILEKRFWLNYGTIGGVGFLLILIAGPIEAFVTPFFLAGLDPYPILASFLAIFTYAIYIYIFLIHLDGFSRLRKGIKRFLSGEMRFGEQGCS